MSAVPRVLFAGGGTGGHLYPALALAEAVRRADPRAEVMFVGARRGVEARVLPERGVPHVLLPLEPIRRAKPWQNWRLIPAMAQSVAGLECTSCHEQHHEPDTQCRACHVAPPDRAHNMRSHLTCAGAQCHDPVPFQGVPRTRELCLSCHQQQVNHQPGRNCAQCHTLPGSLPGAARGSGD